MRRLLFEVVLWGQDPDTAERNRLDWESYLFDFSQDHSSAETRFAVVKASASHIWWRISASNGQTTIPILVIAAMIGVVLAYFSAIAAPGSSVYADAHTGVGSLLLAASFARTPWKLEYSRLRAGSFILVGTGLIHAVIVFDFPQPAYLLSVVALGLIAIATIGTGLSSFVTKTSLGGHVQFWWLCAVAMVIKVVANILSVPHLENSGAVTALGVLTIVELAFLPQLWRLWNFAQQTAPPSAPRTFTNGEPHTASFT